MHYNTTKESGATLRQFEMISQTQEQRVLNYFRRYGFGLLLTPSEVRVRVFNHKTKLPEITSVRRALTNLTSEGNLIKSKQKRMGPHGRHEYCWKLAHFRLNHRSD